MSERKFYCAFDPSDSMVVSKIDTVVGGRVAVWFDKDDSATVHMTPMEAMEMAHCIAAHALELLKKERS
jgi:hypothetical protein